MNVGVKKVGVELSITLTNGTGMLVSAVAWRAHKSERFRLVNIRFDKI